MRKLFAALAVCCLVTLVACKGETVQTVTEQSVADFEASYDALTSAYIGAEHTKRLPDDIVSTATITNQIVYPYVKSLRVAAELHQPVSYITFVAASTALMQFQHALASGNIDAGVMPSVANAAYAGKSATTETSSK